MKNGLFGLWSILALSFAIFLFASSADHINVGAVELKNSGMAAALTAKLELPADEFIDAGSQAIPATYKKSENLTDSLDAVVDTTAKTILFIGDSMLEGLSPRLAAYAQFNGHTLYTVIWYSSTSKIWSDAKKLTAYIQKFKPDYIFICLGANELFVRNITSKRDVCVKNIIKEAGNIPYVWIGPPNWKEDTGINTLISKNAGAGHYFKSDGMDFERSKDGAHPTRQSASLWMDSVARWVTSHSAHPIKMDVPDIQSARPKRVIALQPQK